MFDFLPSTGQVQDLWHATSWTWFGASALFATVGVLLVIVPVVRNIQAAVLCFALAAGTSYMGTLYTQRDLARAEATRVNQEYADFRKDLANKAEVARIESKRKEEENAARILEAEQNTRVARAEANRLRGDAATADTVLRHYQQLYESSRRQLSETSDATGRPELRQPNAISDSELAQCRSTLQNLSADAGITNSLFVQCRDSWPK